MTLPEADADEIGAMVDEPLLLPVGTQLRSLHAQPDDRGTLTEIFRHQWDTGIEPLQWNLVDNEATVLRGVHVHLRHHDYLIVVSGRATIALHDLRRNAPTFGLVTLVPMSGADRSALTIPPGVAHGFYFPVPGTHLYAVDSYWDPADELGCHWLDPELRIDWPDPSARVSPRDAEATSLAALMDAIEPFQDALYPPA